MCSGEGITDVETGMSSAKAFLMAYETGFRKCLRLKCFSNDRKMPQHPPALPNSTKQMKGRDIQSGSLVLIFHAAFSSSPELFCQ